MPIDNNWSVRAEYRYTDYGHITDFAGATTGDLISQHIRDNRVQAGFSYKFDMFAPLAPVVSNTEILKVKGNPLCTLRPGFGRRFFFVPIHRGSSVVTLKSRTAHRIR
ncbi:MAG: hypothetical protein WDN29_12875 [Methylovirgula sp.]